MKRIAAGAAALGAIIAAASPAEAGVAQINVGVLAHNIQVFDPKNANKEEGPDLEVQVDFDSPGFLRWAGAPNPYIVASANLAGRTNFAGFGLIWRIPFAEGWSFDPSLGYVVHDGDLENPYTPADPEYAPYYDDHLLLGSEDLFRTSIGVSRRFGEHWSAELIFSHLSHGQVLGEGRNQGLDQLGLRVGYRFGE